MTMLIFLFIIIALTSFSASESRKQRDEAEVIFNELFALKSFILKSEKDEHLLPADVVHQKLIKLSQLYSSTTNKALRKRKKEIDDLIRTRDVNSEKCNQGSFVDLAIFEEDYRSVSMIQSYLKDNKKKLFKICDIIYRQNLQLDLNNIGREEMEDMLKIYGNIKKASYADDDYLSLESIPVEIVTQALAKYLMNQPRSYSLGEFRTREIGTTDYYQEMKRILFDVCGNVEFSTRKTLSFYHKLSGDEDLKNDFDSWVTEWLTNVKICRTLRDHFNYIEAHVMSAINNQEANMYQPDRE